MPPMAKARFYITVFGGKADEKKVEVSTLAHVLQGISTDLRDVCRNIAYEDQETAWEAKLESCRIYVTGKPEGGHSLVVPCEMEDTDIVWGEKSLHTYANALTSIRENLEVQELPHGLDYPILKRIRSYYFSLGEDYSGFKIDIHANGQPQQSVKFDSRLRSAVDSHLAAAGIPQEIVLHGFSLQGVLYEVSDVNYLDPDSELKVEIDPHDGTRWVCHVPKDLLGQPIDHYFTKTVRVEGIARFRPKKPELEVKHLQILEDLTFDQALARFIDSGRDVWRDVDPDEYLDELRDSE